MAGSWWELRQARRKGRRDGRAGVPSVDQGALPFDLREIRARAEERVERIVQSWTQQDRALATELGELEQRSVAANARLDDAEMQRDSALAEHERRTADEDERLSRLQEQIEALPTPDAPAFRLEEPALVPPAPLVGPVVPATLPAPATPLVPAASGAADEPAESWAYAAAAADASWRGIGPAVYWPLIALIVLGEIPLNAFAFRLFHESDLLTYVMTVTVAVGLVAFAHGLGLLLARPERSAVEKVLVGACIVIPLGAITVISFVRHGYLVNVGGDSGVGPLLGTLAFGLINLLVFGAATALSYLRHDPRTLVNRRTAARALERERARIERRRADEQRGRLKRQHRLEDDVARRREAQQRKQLAVEQERRRRELALQAERHEAALVASKNEVLARREQIADGMRPLLEAGRARQARIAELNRLVDEARAALGAIEERITAIGIERRAALELACAAHREEVARYERLACTYGAANVRARAMHDVPRCLEEVPHVPMPAALRDALLEVA
jgi:hypothetical protein